jgi:hypothetical protein
MQSPFNCVNVTRLPSENDACKNLEYRTCEGNSISSQDATDKSIENTQLAPCTVNSDRERSVTLPAIESFRNVPEEVISILTVDACSNWFRNNAKESSVDERIFVLTVGSLGLETAKYVAERLRWNCSRPMQDLQLSIDMLKRQWYKSQYESSRPSNTGKSS